MKACGFRQTEKQLVMQQAPVGFEYGQSEWVVFLMKETLWSSQWPSTIYTNIYKHTYIIIIYTHTHMYI